MNKTAKAFAPAGLTSFFEICDRTADGQRIVDLEIAGSRGGGFGLKKGVCTQVSIAPAKVNTLQVTINGKLAPEAETTITTIKTLLSKIKNAYSVFVYHKIDVPIGAGFGTSAGGALTAGLALREALDIPLTYNQVGKIAHNAEIQCQTGLGTVGPLMVSGCVLTLEPGAPGVSVIDRLSINPDYVVVAGVFGPTPTKQVLASPEKRQEINRYGRKTLEEVLDEPSLENFLSCCWDFAQKAGFTTSRVRTLVNVAKKAGAVGAAQNMVGEAAHAIVLKENAPAVAEAFKKILPKKSILVSQIDFQGARLV